MSAVLVGALLVGPEKSQYSTFGAISQETVTVDSVGLAVSPVAAGAAEPPPQATSNSKVSHAAVNNLNERKSIGKSRKTMVSISLGTKIEVKPLKFE